MTASMKICLFIFPLILSFTACQQKESAPNTLPTDSVGSKLVNKKKITPQVYPLVIDSLSIGKDKYFVIQDDPRSENDMNLVILNSKGDTIYKHDGYGTNGFKLDDFDDNGIQDILLYQLSNDGGISDLIMYDTKTKGFKNVEGFYDYNEPYKVEGTKYWYSYHGSGCADMDWDSDLFYIENFKAIRVGNIQGIGCEGEPKNGIFIYKVEGEKRILIKENLRKPGFHNDKWDFIEEYWNKNYQKFD